MIDRRFWIWTFAVLAIGLALRAPSLPSGFGMDDFAQLAMLEGVYPAERGIWDLFSFSSGDPQEVHTLMSRGSLAWWSHPQLKLSALRPLSSLLMWLDVQMFGHQALWHHAHTLLWWALMLLSAALLLRRLLPARWAMLALLLYALDECHTYPIGWLANRNAIVSATFAFLALYAHVRHREDGWARGRWLSVLGLMLSLAGGEYGLCILPFFVLYELLAAPGDRKSRARALIPMFVLFGVYVAIHRALGFGSFASNVYVDPLREPLAWLGIAKLRVPILVADMFLAIPTGKLALYPKLMQAQAWLGPAAGILLAFIVPAMWRRLDATGRKRLVWLLAAAVLGIVPVASSFVSARLLLIPAIGGHAVVAALLLDAFDRIRDRAHRFRPWTLVRSTVALALFVAHVGLASYWGFEETRNIHRLNIGTRQASLMMQVDDTKVEQQRLVVLTAADPMTLLYPALVRWVEGHPLPRSWWVLSLAPKPHTLTRITDNAFEMEVVDGAMLTGPVEQLFRRPRFRFRPGQHVYLDGLTVTILKMKEYYPQRVRFTFETSVDDPSLVFLLATKRGMLHYPMGPVGATMAIPPATLPLVLDIQEQDRAAGN
ncbi:MAG: hypothetical protein K0V04_28360 [Deltaproteobacteria bacterium]|nr:hypothetical protein [Deltaproteobacteria bacterium]